MWLYDVTPYWVHHAVVALSIAAVVGIAVYNATAGLTAGAAFYSGREFTQWESGLAFDWPGLISPLLACLAVGLIISAFSKHPRKKQEGRLALRAALVSLALFTLSSIVLHK